MGHFGIWRHLRPLGNLLSLAHWLLPLAHGLLSLAYWLLSLAHGLLSLGHWLGLGGRKLRLLAGSFGNRRRKVVKKI